MYAIRSYYVTCWLGRGKEKGLQPMATTLFYISGAVEVNRTLDLLITNQLLYQLSYIG